MCIRPFSVTFWSRTPEQQPVKCAARNYVTFLRQRNTFWGYVLQGLHLLTESFVLYWILHHFVVVLVQNPAAKIHWVLINRPIIKYIVFPYLLPHVEPMGRWGARIESRPIKIFLWRLSWPLNSLRVTVRRWFWRGHVSTSNKSLGSWIYPTWIYTYTALDISIDLQRLWSHRTC